MENEYEKKSAIYNKKNYDNIIKTIGMRVKLLRNQKEMTQYELSAILNISRNHLAQIETGRSAPSLKLLYDLALFFECSLDYLVGISSIKNKKNNNTSDLYKILNANNIKIGDKQILEKEKESLKRIIELIFKLWK